MSDAVDSSPDGSALRRSTPTRTCVGCRQRAAKSELVRVVAVEGTGAPDPRGQLPGRGAYLHHDRGCLDLAERRRAFPRALRLTGGLDLTTLRAYVETAPPQRHPPQRAPAVARAPAQSTHDTEAGRDGPDREGTERSMSMQR